MGQVAPDDEEVAGVVLSGLERLERAFEACLKDAQAAGDVRGDLNPRDAARHLMAFSQGMALLGRGSRSSKRSPSPVRAALAALRPPSPK